MGRVKPPSIKINSVAPQAPAQPKTTRSAPRGGTSRQIERPKIVTKPNYTNYIIWGVLIVAVAVGAFFVMKSTPSTPPVAKKPPKPAPPPEPEPAPIAPAPPPLPPPNQDPPTPEKSPVKKIKFKGKEYTVPSEFMGGASGATSKYPPKGVVPADAESASKVLEKGEVDSLLKEPWKTFLPVMANALSDDEKIAQAAFDYLHKISAKYKLPGLVEGETFQLAPEFFTDPNARAAAYSQFLEFQEMLQGYWEKEKAGMDPLSKESVLAKDADWNKLIVDLAGYQLTMEKGSESKYTYEESEENLGKKSYEKVKRMGKTAYPYLAKYILDEDPQRMRTAIVVLHMLTGYPARIPKHPEREKAYREWLDNLGLSDDKIPK